MPEVIVGRIGRPHGTQGELSVEPRTDEPERRFTAGATLAVSTPSRFASSGAGRPTSLTVRSVRRHQSRLLVTFDGVRDRTEAEALRGLMLAAPVATHETPDDPEEFYDHQLVGLRVHTADGAEVGDVTHVVHGSAQDLIGIRTDDGREVLFPFVHQLVPTVDVPNKRILVDDRPGLLQAAPGIGGQ